MYETFPVAQQVTIHLSVMLKMFSCLKVVSAIINIDKDALCNYKVQFLNVD